MLHGRKEPTYNGRLTRRRALPLLVRETQPIQCYVSNIFNRVSGYMTLMLAANPIRHRADTSFSTSGDGGVLSCHSACFSWSDLAQAPRLPI